MMPLFGNPPVPRAVREQPAYRAANMPADCSTGELLAAVVGGASASAVADRLLHRFGSLHAVGKASQHELLAVNGLGAAGASRLMAAAEISRRLLAPPDQPARVSSPSDAAALLRPLLIHRDQEYLYVILLSTRNQVIGEPREVYHGSLNTSIIRVAEVYRQAIAANAAGIIVAHNHPSGDPSPSPVIWRKMSRGVQMPLVMS
jgi:DNA repair protein RadC